MYSGMAAPTKPHLRTALELGHPVGHVVDIDGCDTLESSRDGLAVVGGEVVVGPEDGGEEVAALHEGVEEDGEAGVDDADVYAVQVHVLDSLFGDVGAGPGVLPRVDGLEGVGVFEAPAGLAGHAGDVEGGSVFYEPEGSHLGIPHGRGLVTELGFHPFEPEVGGLDDVVVR